MGNEKSVTTTSELDRWPPFCFPFSSLQCRLHNSYVIEGRNNTPSVLEAKNFLSLSRTVRKPTKYHYGNANNRFKTAIKVRSLTLKKKRHRAEQPAARSMDFSVTVLDTVRNTLVAGLGLTPVRLHVDIQRTESKKSKQKIKKTNQKIEFIRRQCIVWTAT